VVTAWAVAAHDRARTNFDVAQMAATIRGINLGKRSAR
jgi:hypothetical protein